MPERPTPTEEELVEIHGEANMENQERNVAELQEKYHGQIGKTVELKSLFAPLEVRQRLSADFGGPYTGDIRERTRLTMENNTSFIPSALSLVRKYPAIFTHPEEEYKKSWDENLQKDMLFVSMRTFYSTVTVNEDGALPWGNPIRQNIVNLTAEDLAESERIFLEKASTEQLELSDLLETLNILSQNLDNIQKVIAAYQEGQRPTIHDMLNGGSITEQSLQITRSGTPVEGQSGILKRLTQPYDYELGKLTLPEGECKIGGYFGKYNLLVRGREIADRYYSFINSLNPDTRPNVPRDEQHTSHQLYLDREWERRDEAIVLGEELRDVLKETIEYYESIAEKISQTT